MGSFLSSIGEDGVLGTFLKGPEWFPPSLEKFGEEFHILESESMDECPQPVDDDIEEMADGEDKDEDNPTHIGPA